MKNKAKKIILGATLIALLSAIAIFKVCTPDPPIGFNPNTPDPPIGTMLIK